MRTVNKPLLKQLIRLRKNGRTLVAEAADCSPHTVSNWLREEYRWGPAEYHAVRVAKFLKVDVDEIFPLARGSGRRSA